MRLEYNVYNQGQIGYTEVAWHELIHGKLLLNYTVVKLLLNYTKIL